MVPDDMGLIENDTAPGDRKETFAMDSLLWLVVVGGMGEGTVRRDDHIVFREVDGLLLDSARAMEGMHLELMLLVDMGLNLERLAKNNPARGTDVPARSSCS